MHFTIEAQAYNHLAMKELETESSEPPVVVPNPELPDTGGGGGGTSPNPNPTCRLEFGEISYIDKNLRISMEPC